MYPARMPPLSARAVKPSYIRTTPATRTAAPIRIATTVSDALGQTSSAMPSATMPSAPSSTAHQVCLAAADSCVSNGAMPGMPVSSWPGRSAPAGGLAAAARSSALPMCAWRWRLRSCCRHQWCLHQRCLPPYCQAGSCPASRWRTRCRDRRCCLRPCQRPHPRACHLTARRARSRLAGRYAIRSSRLPGELRPPGESCGSPEGGHVPGMTLYACTSIVKSPSSRDHHPSRVNTRLLS